MPIKMYILLAALVALLPCGTVSAQRAFPLNAEPRIYDYEIEPTYYGSVELGDYDADGDLDVLLTGRTGDVIVTKVYCQSRVILTYNIGEVAFFDTVRTFIEASTNLPHVWQSSAKWGDYDGDGDADVLVSGRTTLHGSGVTAPTTRLFESRSGQFFADSRSEFVNVFAGEVAWGDYDGDGDLDVIVTGSTRTIPPYEPATRLYRNDRGVFSVVPTDLPNVTFGAVAWSDIDGDGDLDLALQGATETGVIITDLFRNDGGGSFSPLNLDIPPLFHGSFDWGDVDGDGDDDLLVTGGYLDPHLHRGLTAIFENEGAVFRRLETELPGALTGSAKFADFDLDGRMDLAISGAPSVLAQPRFSVYLNNGNGFNAAIPPFGLMLGDIAVGDYNEDGDPDVIVTGLSGERQSYANFYQNRVRPDKNIEDGGTVVPDLLGIWSGCVQRFP